MSARSDDVNQAIESELPSLITLFALLRRPQELNDFLKRYTPEAVAAVVIPEGAEPSQHLKDYLESKYLPISNWTDIRNYILYVALACPESLKIILNNLPPERRAHALSKKFNLNHSVVVNAISMPGAAEAFKIIIECLEPTNRAEFLASTIRQNGLTILQELVRCKVPIAGILSSLTKIEQTEIVRQQIVHTDSPMLYFLLNHEEALAYADGLLTSDDWLSALERQRFTVDYTRKTETLLHKAVREPDLLIKIRERVNPEGLVDLLLLRNSDGKTVLDVAVESGSSVSVQLDGSTGKRIIIRKEPLMDILSALPPGKVAELASGENVSGSNLLHRAIPNCPLSARYILSCIPKEQRLEALSQIGDDGLTVAQKAQTLYEALPCTDDVTACYDTIRSSLREQDLETLNSVINQPAKLTAEGSRERHYFDLLLAYTQRIAGYRQGSQGQAAAPNPFAVDTNTIQFNSGFMFMPDSRAINRKLNYLTAMRLMHQLNRGQPIAEVFDARNITAARREICTENPVYFRGLNGDSPIRSFELNRALRAAAEEIATPQLHAAPSQRRF